jgi:DNA modification methylase
MQEKELDFWGLETTKEEVKNEVNVKKYEYHEYANLFPMIPQEELKILADDIKENGLVNPIVLFEGKIIDGRNRYKACISVNIEPQFTNLKTDKPLEYVISTNLKRRHLDTSQRAMIAANLANMNVGNPDYSANLQNSAESKISIETAAKILNVGVRSVNTAKEIKENFPERIKDVEDGKVSVSAVVKEERKKEQIKERRVAAIENEVVIDKNLHLGDCVEVLKTLETNSVDCVVMDPPYAISYKDTRESFNPDFEDDPEVILPMLKECFKELNRICKPDAHIYCFFGMSEYINFYNLLNDEFGMNVDKIPLIWVKNNHTMCDFSSKYALKYEPIFFISNKQRKLNYPVSPDVLNYNIPTGKLHKTQKPLDLCEYLINNSTVEGEVVLDPFMGSGTTCLAAKNNNRKYIGIEKNEDIFNIAIERLK